MDVVEPVSLTVEEGEGYTMEANPEGVALALALED